jgi:hypothetical protein
LAFTTLKSPFKFAARFRLFYLAPERLARKKAAMASPAPTSADPVSSGCKEACV